MLALLLACARPMAVGDSPDSDEPPGLEWTEDTGPTTATVTFENATDSHLNVFMSTDTMWVLDGVGLDPGQSTSSQLDTGIWTFVLHDDASHCWSATGVNVRVGDALEYTVTSLPGEIVENLNCTGSG
ncbi:hypothetical protein LBMAG42_05160 [Deltaproteobacteria bacterium]|nr:hypothetical protein LBMAG42_05160 [Deltaproteobacteria bacterium]